MGGGEAKAVLSVERGLHTLVYGWGGGAVRSGEPPRAEITGTSEGIFVVSAPGEPFASLAGPGAGLVVLAEKPGTIELTLVAGEAGGSLAASFELKRVEAQRPAETPAPVRPKSPLPEGGADFTVHAHVSLRGDVSVPRGHWICGPGAPGRIEGLCLQATGPALPVEYQVATAGHGGGWTGWFPAGAYAGSRGKAAPLIGLRLRLAADAPAHLALKAEGSFLGAPTVMRIGREVELAGPSLLDPLVGLALDLVAADESPAMPAGPGTSGRIRVFRRATRPAEAA